MAKVMPALREKKRYLVFQVLGVKSTSTALEAVTERFSYLFGALQSAKASIRSVKSNSSRCIVSVNREYLDKLKASIALVKTINSSDVLLRSVYASGMLANAKEKLKGGL